jgi:hypothetical protein
MQDSKKRKIIEKVITRFKTPIKPCQLAKGLDVEREHSSSNDGAASKSTDVVKGNKMKIAKIAAVHLKEDPKYYSHLSAMEKKYSNK